MTTCPDCKKEIHHLHYIAYEFMKADFIAEDKDNWTFQNWESLDDCRGEPEFRCPRCGALLFTGDAKDRACEFLLSS